MKEKINYYTTKRIDEMGADYNLIIGERSNGKTTSVLRKCLETYCKSKYTAETGIIRRWDEDLKGKAGEDIMKAVNTLGWVDELSKGDYNRVVYHNRKFYLALYDEDGEKIKEHPTPFAHAFALTKEEHYKMQAFPLIKVILFDEFLARGSYLPNEFVIFANLLSTIIRLRTDVKIYMCGNTINKSCPYFAEFGITNFKKQKKGTIDLYTYSTEDNPEVLRVAVEYCDFTANNKKKASNKYFCFNNPKLKMITEGEWEFALYPHLPVKYKPKECLYKFYVIFEGDILQGNVICVEDETFLYFHRKTTPLHEDNEQLVYSCEDNHRLNYRKNIMKPYGRLDTKIAELLIRREKAFYQDNEVGEILNNYLKWCRQQTIIRA